MSYFSVWLDDLTRGAPESGVSSVRWTKETLTVSPGVQSALLGTSCGNIQQQDIWGKWADCPMRVHDSEGKSRLLALQVGLQVGSSCPPVGQSWADSSLHPVLFQNRLVRPSACGGGPASQEHISTFSKATSKCWPNLHIFFDFPPA